MSLKLVGVVALAGLSAVAAYLFLFRKKEEETEESAEQIKEDPKITDKEKETFEKEITELIKEVPKTTDKAKDDFELIKEVPKTTDKAEDDLQEMETSVSPTVDKDIAQIGSIEDNSSQPAKPAQEIHSFETEGGDLTGKTESLMEWIDRQLKEAESKSRNATPAPESQIIRNASPDLNKNETDNILITQEKGNSEESLVSESRQTITNPDENNVTTMDATYSEESLTSGKEAKINLEEDIVTAEALDAPERDDNREDSLASEIKQTFTNILVKDKISTVEETKSLTKKDNTPDKEQNSEESLASEIVENNPDLDQDNSTEIEDTQVKEEKDDSLDSIEIIEMSEVEHVPTQEETVQSNANQQHESQETVEPQPNKDDWNEKCTEEEIQSIEIISVDNEEVEAKNFSDSADSINNQENLTSIESINVSIADSNADNLIPGISDVDNTTAQPEKSIPDETDVKINDEEDSSAVNILSDVKISEVSPDKNGLAVHAEFAESTADLAKNIEIENETLKDAECNMNPLVDEDSDAEIQLLKGSSEKKNSILEDSDLSGNDSDSGSCAESVNTEVTVDEAKSDDSDKEVIGNGEEGSKDELNDSIGLMLRPSWQIKKPQKTLSGMDAKLTSI